MKRPTSYAAAPGPARREAERMISPPDAVYTRNALHHRGSDCEATRRSRIRAEPERAAETLAEA
jgi:hypothetical protein